MVTDSPAVGGSCTFWKRVAHDREALLGTGDWFSKKPPGAGPFVLKPHCNNRQQNPNHTSCSLAGSAPEAILQEQAKQGGAKSWGSSSNSSSTTWGCGSGTSPYWWSTIIPLRSQGSRKGRDRMGWGDGPHQSANYKILCKCKAWVHTDSKHNLLGLLQS